MTARAITSKSNYRSAVTGRYVTQRQAERNPRETVRETRPAPAAPSKGGRR